VTSAFGDRFGQGLSSNDVSLEISRHLILSAR
jgi:hypothetical protein